MSNRAWVTLATNDSYGLGALVLANSLRRVGSEYPSVVLITPSVTDAMRERLNAVFSDVVTVDVLDSRDAAHLALLQRPELGITFTKIHCWNLTQFEKCVFLDADTLVVQNSDELFEREELSAAPDVGWPDCFNSGVFVFKPSAETFERLITFAQERGSFDGGDQAEERRKVGKLQLSPPAVADPLPTPDSEAEDAAALAHAIIASELHEVKTPTVTSPLTPAEPASPLALKAGLTVEQPQVPTPPVGAVSLAQIGVKPKEKTSTAAQLESSIAAATEKTDAPKDAPKKKIVKKVVKKDKDAAGADAPVPPPRKKEKKPKEK